MGEIKSTLELVMERTRHLRQSEEEKQEQATAEFKKSLSGLIQKFLDGALTPDRFRQDLHLLQETSPTSDRGIILDEISKRLDLDENWAWAMKLLREGFDIDPEGITAVLDEYRKVMNRAALERTNEIRKELREKQGVSGTAVVPNLAADRKWALVRQRLHERFEPILDQEFDKLKRSLD